ncbi:unnamed protein product, partial [Leptidea sinapis]
MAYGVERGAGATAIPPRSANRFTSASSVVTQCNSISVAQFGSAAVFRSVVDRPLGSRHSAARSCCRAMDMTVDVCAYLAQHKSTLFREICDTNVLDVLVKKGLFSVNDLEVITSASNGEKCNQFIEVVSKQSGAKLQELCSVINNECPKLAKELMNDRRKYLINGYSTVNAKENMVMNHNLNRYV